MAESENYKKARTAYLEYYRRDKEFRAEGAVEQRPYVVDAMNEFKSCLSKCTPEERVKLKREVISKQI